MNELCQGRKRRTPGSSVGPRCLPTGVTVRPQQSGRRQAHLTWGSFSVHLLLSYYPTVQYQCPCREGTWELKRIKVRCLNCAIQNITGTIKKTDAEKVGQRERHAFLGRPVELTFGLRLPELVQSTFWHWTSSMSYGTQFLKSGVCPLLTSQHTYHVLGVLLSALHGLTHQILIIQWASSYKRGGQGTEGWSKSPKVTEL